MFRISLMPKLIRRPIGWCGVAAIGVCAGPVCGGIIYHDNAAGRFFWQESYYLAGFHHGTSLDITLPPTQSGEVTSYSLQSYSEVYLTSGQTVTTSVAADGAGASVGQAPRIIVNSPGPYARFVDPATAYAADAGIGPTVPGGTWAAYADVNWRSGPTDVSLIGGHAFIGVRLNMPDGLHYGWVDLVDNGYYGAPSFSALGWAWETTPNTPLPAGAIPGPATLAGIATAVIALPRRRRA